MICIHLLEGGLIWSACSKIERCPIKTYVILSRLSTGAIRDPADFKQLAATVSEKIKAECPGIVWKNSYVTLGRFDVVDVV